MQRKTSNFPRVVVAAGALTVLVAGCYGPGPHMGWDDDDHPHHTRGYGMQDDDHRGPPCDPERRREREPDQRPCRVDR